MRTLSAAKIAAIEALDRQVLVRVRIAGHLGVLQDYTRAGGSAEEWLDSVTISPSVEERTTRASVTLHRETATGSLSPEMNATAPIDIARRILIDIAIINQNAYVSAEDWLPVYEGVIDNVLYGGEAGKIVLPLRDRLWKFYDAGVLARTFYGNTAGTAPLEAEMQSLIDDVLGPGVLTLVVPSSPGFGIYEFEQGFQGLGEALQRFIDVIGWDFRDRYNDSVGAWQLTLYQPQRGKTTPDYVFSLDNYHEITDLMKSSDGIKNHGIMEYAEGLFVEVTDDASVAEFGGIKRPLYLDATQDPLVQDSATALALMDAAIKDTAQPTTTQTVDGPYDPRFEVGDLLRWPADSVHRSSDVDLAITGMDHVLRPAPDECTTTYYCRGRPTGGSRRWKRLHAARRGADRVRDLLPPPPEPIVVPTVKAIPSQASETGIMTLEIEDPDGFVTGTSFEVYAGGGTMNIASDPASWSGFDGAAPYALTFDVPLVEGHASVIVWGMRYDLGTGAVWITGSHTYDLDVIPDVQIQGVSRNDDGELEISVKGDEDTADVWVTFEVGADPEEPTAPTDAGFSTGARSGVISTAAVVVPGDVVWVKARGVDADGNLAPEANIAVAKHEVAGVPDGSVTSDKLVPGAVLAEHITRQAQSWGSNVEIFAANWNTIQWFGGTIQMADGTTQAVNAGTSSTISGVTYFYFDGTATLKQTTDYTVVVGSEGNILMAVAKPAPTTEQTAFIVPAQGAMTGISVNEQQISASSIVANKIRAGAITTDKLAANAVTAAKIDVISLSAISADLGTVTAGSLEANVIVASESFTASQIDVDGRLAVAGGGGSPFVVIDGGHPNLNRALIVSGASISENGTGVLTFWTGTGTGSLGGVQMILSGGTIKFEGGGTAGATEAAWVQVDIGGTNYFMRMHASP